MDSLEQTKIFFLQKENYLYLYFLNKITAVYSFSLKEYLKDLIRNNKIKNIWIDLSKCTYVDSTTIGALIQIHNMAESVNGKLFLCNLSVKINKIMENSHLNTFLNIKENKQLLALEDKFLNVLAISEKEELTEEFIMDAHHDIIKVAPDLKNEFINLFELLEKKV
ncbi:MAG: STAS domain-containing protein [Spirochaetes bacterium]|nr:STAS domain-containing protein [Spirochaetota bacterium]